MSTTMRRLDELARAVENGGHGDDAKKIADLLRSLPEHEKEDIFDVVLVYAKDWI